MDPLSTKTDWTIFTNTKAGTNELIKFLIEAVDQTGNHMVTGGLAFDAKVITPSKKGMLLVTVFIHLFVRSFVRSFGRLFVRSTLTHIYFSEIVEIPLIVIDHEDGTYTGTFNPKVGGNHTISITVKTDNGEWKPIVKSPHSFYVSPPAFGMISVLPLTTFTHRHLKTHVSHNA